jgi:hypothetical protein
MLRQAKKSVKKNAVDFQRVPFHVHRQNSAERAIQTWKNHFCAGLATCDPKFPLTEWGLLMPQADITLNLLRSSRGQPKLSAHACLCGAFDFNQSPLAPPGTRAVVHVTPNQRQNMAPHGVYGLTYATSLLRSASPTRSPWIGFLTKYLSRSTPDRYPHVDPPSRHSGTTTPLPHVRLPHFQRLHPNCENPQTSHSASPTNEPTQDACCASCSRTEGAYRQTPCTRTEGAATIGPAFARPGTQPSQFR